MCRSQWYIWRIHLVQSGARKRKLECWDHATLNIIHNLLQFIVLWHAISPILFAVPLLSPFSPLFAALISLGYAFVPPLLPSPPFSSSKFELL